jgi:protoporphyrinogen oxidase
VQSHLTGLSEDAVLRCVLELAELKYSRRSGIPANLEQALERSFGRTLCELFLIPYNRKFWRRPLSELAPVFHEEAATPPDFESVLRGILKPVSATADDEPAGWYPRPPRDAKLRGMELLPEALAATVDDLRLNHTVTEIDLRQRVVTCCNYDREVKFRFLRQLCNTLPLPHFVRLCARDLPEDLRRGAAVLRYNRVISVMYRVRGMRPQDCGHFAYFADEDLIFSRLAFMHQFDPESSPMGGWGLIAEITEAAEAPIASPDEVATRCLGDIRRAGVLPRGCEILDQESRVIGPAYVVSTPESLDIALRLHRFLRSNGVELLGRYGRWEDSSMGEVIRDARQWALRTEARVTRPAGMKAG